MTDNREQWTVPELKTQASSSTEQNAGAGTDGIVEASGGSFG